MKEEMIYDGDTKRFHKYILPQKRLFDAPFTGSIYIRKSDGKPPDKIEVTVTPIEESLK